MSLFKMSCLLLGPLYQKDRIPLYRIGSEEIFSLIYKEHFTKKGTVSQCSLLHLKLPSLVSSFVLILVYNPTVLAQLKPVIPY